FGPLGNVIFELSGALRTDAIGQATFAVRGTIGPLAARVRLVAFGADAAVFDVLALVGDERTTLGMAGTGALFGVTARFGRNVIVDVGHELYLTSAGFSGRLDSRLRLLRAIGANEVRVYLEGATVRRGPDFGSDIAPGAGSEPDPRSWHVAV